MLQKIFFASILLLSISCIAQAQWKKSGFSFNEGITSLTASNNVLYASTSMDVAYDGNIFTSADGGVSWKPLKPDIPDSYPKLLFVAAIQGGSKYLFASTEYSMYSLKLGDPGATWKENHDMIGTVHSMTQVKKYGQKIYAAVDGSGLYRSDDYGQHWVNEVFAAKDTYNPIKFTMIAATDSNFYVATTNGLFASATAESGAFVQPDGYVVSYIAVAGKKIFVFSYTDGMRVSADNGQTWAAAKTGLENCKDVYCLYTAKNGYLFAGTDRGIFLYNPVKQSWKSFNEGLPDAANVWSITATGTKLVIYTQNSIWYRSLTEIK